MRARVKNWSECASLLIDNASNEWTPFNIERVTSANALNWGEDNNDGGDDDDDDDDEVAVLLMVATTTMTITMTMMMCMGYKLADF